MGLLIGNIANTILPARVRQAVSEDIPMYGVKFTSSSTVGVRTYDNAILNWGRSSNTTEGVDDFKDIAPFNVKEVCRVWNSTTNTASFYHKSAYSDAEWQQIREGTHATINGDIMIEFPEFWYRRVDTADGLEIIVAPEYKVGFTPDPWHYTNGVHHQKRYITKYNLSSGFRSISKVGTLVSTNMNTFRTGLKTKGMDMLSAPAWWSIGMLMMVKYATTDMQAVVSAGYNSGDTTYNSGNADSVKGLDGSATSVSTNEACLTFGIENMYGNCWKYIDGCFECNGYLYIKEAEDMTVDPTSLAELQSSYIKIDYPVQSGGTNIVITKIANDNVYDWFFYPSNSVGSKSIVCNDNFWSNNDGSLRLLMIGGSAWRGSTDGLFCFSSEAAVGSVGVNSGAVGVC